MTLNGLKVLITGGAGFIGSHITESLVRAGARVTVYDNFSFGKREHLATVADDVEVIEGDILDREALGRAMQGKELVSHQAAQLEIFLAAADPHADLRTNTIGTLNVLALAKQFGVSKVINASSACVYGQKEGSVTEEDMPIPNWEYGVSKLAAERYGTIYSTYQDLPVISLRYGIVYGPREWYRRVLTIFLKLARDGKDLVVFGDGEQVRDFINVADVVDLHNRIVVDEVCRGDVFNVGTNVPTSVNQLADAVIAATGQPITVIHESIKEGEFSKLVPEKKRNTAELKLMLLNHDKATRTFGWQPKVSLIEGLRGEYEWLLSQQNAWQKIHYTVA
ncbi:NAD-dependent epimerase/dehydratase family protein [Candidatus Berkelbacteria bacterium]|nr:NAD-dependent epimerase/dehydratase family protein [Candidatus Berkelbacteria bacterium]